MANNSLTPILLNKHFLDTFNLRFSNLLGTEISFEEQKVETANYDFSYIQTFYLKVVRKGHG